MTVYAWGVPLIWTLLTLYAEKYKPLPRDWNGGDWNPVIGETTCFFESMFFFFLVSHHALEYLLFFYRTSKLEEPSIILCNTR